MNLDLDTIFSYVDTHYEFTYPNQFALFFEIVPN